MYVLHVYANGMCSHVTLGTYVGEELLTCSAVENSVRPLCLACMKTVVRVTQAKSWLCCWMYLLTTKGHPNYFKSRALLIKYL